jgi:hypothetical protein
MPDAILRTAERSRIEIDCRIVDDNISEMVIAMAGRQLCRRAFRLVGLFCLAGFRQQFAALVLNAAVGDLDRDGPRLQIAGFED